MQNVSENKQKRWSVKWPENLNILQSDVLKQLTALLSTFCFANIILKYFI